MNISGVADNIFSSKVVRQIKSVIETPKSSAENFLSNLQVDGMMQVDPKNSSSNVPKEVMTEYLVKNATETATNLATTLTNAFNIVAENVSVAIKEFSEDATTLYGLFDQENGAESDFLSTEQDNGTVFGNETVVNSTLPFDIYPTKGHLGGLHDSELLLSLFGI